MAALLLTACGEEPARPPSAGGSPPPAAGDVATASLGDPEKGRQIWLAQCVTCHHPDPAKDGTVGPAVKGSSPALVEARVLRATYPDGYTPKRDSRVMPPRPDLARSVADLAAFLR